MFYILFNRYDQHMNARNFNYISNVNKRSYIKLLRKNINFTKLKSYFVGFDSAGATGAVSTAFESVASVFAVESAGAAAGASVVAGV